MDTDTSVTEEGVPRPRWTMRGTRAEIMARIGGDFEWLGEGWHEREDAVIAIWSDPSNGAANQFVTFLETIGLTPTSEQESETFECSSWSTDPRPRLAALLHMPDRTEITTPQVLHEIWDEITKHARELKQWADDQFMAAAMAHGAAPSRIPTIPEIQQQLLARMPKACTRTNGSMQVFRFGNYVIHVIPPQEVDDIRKGGIPDYARLFSVGEVNVALTLSPMAA